MFRFSFLISLFAFIATSNFCISNKECRCMVEQELADIEVIIPYDDPLHEKTRLHQYASNRGTLEERDESLQPTMIIYPKSDKDIKDIVDFASDCGYKISVRSGGHQYSGLSSCNRLNGKCIQIDMKYFDNITYNKHDDNDKELITSITVGAGVKLLNLAKSNADNKVGIDQGVCGSVGAGGHFQSSSQGAWTRSLGLGMDWIFRVKIVTADGRIRNLHKNSKKKRDRDLFWAILGGSPGSWGVVIEYEFHPIYDDDYPNSSYFRYVQFYSDEFIRELYSMMIDLLNNEYFKMASDLTPYSIIGSLLKNPEDSTTLYGQYVDTGLSWSGNKHGDINNVIPNHPENKTWYQVLVKPFKDLNDKYSKSQLPGEFEGPVSISALFELGARNDRQIEVPPFRYYNAHSAYKQNVLDKTIFSNETLKTEWVESITNQISKLTNNNSLGIVFQLQYLVPSEDNYVMHENHVIHYDPLQNSIAYPLRDIPFQVDSWILFGNDEEYDVSIANFAKQAADDLFNVLNSNQVDGYYINSFAYTDKSMEEYQNYESKFEHFFPERLDVFEKLKEIKTNIDCGNIFDDGAITIPSNGNCRDYVF